MRIKPLASAALCERADGSLDARLGGQRFGKESLPFDRDLVPLLDAALTLPGFLGVRPGFDHLVPEQEPDGEGDLDLALLDGPEIREPLLEFRELQGLVLFIPLVMRLGLVELPEDREECGPNRVLASVRRLRVSKYSEFPYLKPSAFRPRRRAPGFPASLVPRPLSGAGSVKAEGS